MPNDRQHERGAGSLAASLGIPHRLDTRETGYANLSAEGFETVDEVVFAEPADMTLLGVRTLEGFGVIVDKIAHRLLPPPRLWLHVTP